MTDPPNKKDNPLANSLDELTFLLEDDITCAVCLDIYEEPVTLQCTHHFCERCVKMLVHKLTVDNQAKQFIPCPLCRVETIYTKDGDLNKNTRLKFKVENMKRKNDGENCLFKDTHSKIQKVTIPRSIKLLEEYDAAIGKGKRTFIPDIHNGYIGYGLDEEKENNSDLRFWRAIIIGPQESPIGQLIYNVQVLIPEDYPKKSPEVRFTSPKIAMECVDAKGLVDLTKIARVDMATVDEGTGQVYETMGSFFIWDENLNIADVLIAIRENMHLESVCNDSSSLSGNYLDEDDASDGENDEKDE